MNIQSISELNKLEYANAKINALSSDINGNTYLEVAKQQTPSSSYDSYSLNLNHLLSSITDILLSLQELIDDLNRLTNNIRNLYVPLSGNVTITGPIAIKPDTSRFPNLAEKASLIVQGNNVVRGYVDIRPYVELDISENKPGNFNIPVLDPSSKYVTINGENAQLHTSTDIDGCALSAKWC